MANKTTFYTKLSLIFLLFFGRTQNVFSQQHAMLANASKTVEYLQKTDNGKSTAERSVEVEIEYWTEDTTKATQETYGFAITSSGGAKQSAPMVNSGSFTIRKEDFKTEHQKKIITFYFLISAAKPPFSAESFQIGLTKGNNTLDAKTGGIASIVIQEQPVEEKLNANPAGFTYLNAVNFDFENSNGSSYAGQLDIVTPYLGKTDRFKILCGIMKINFSQPGNGLVNTSRDYTEIAKIEPLDQIKEGTPYYRQFINLKNVSKNTGLSFYFQPAFKILERKNLQLLAHLHAELLVNSWTTTTTITKLQQVTDTVKAETLGYVTSNINDLDKFYKKSDATVTSTSTNTIPIFFGGIGLSLTANIWDGGHLFVQPTFGLATDYLSAQNLAKESIGKIPGVEDEPKKSIFHLVRMDLKQDLTPNLQAVIGVIVRGRFGLNPAWASYVGLNLGLSGLKKMLK